MLDRGDLDKLVRAVAETRESEIGCKECFEQMDRFAEIEFSGSDVATRVRQLQREAKGVLREAGENYLRFPTAA